MAIISIYSCQNQEATVPRIDEVEFRTDSSLFDFSRKDTFGLFVIPHLKDFEPLSIDEPKTRILKHTNRAIKLVFSSGKERIPNSYHYYQNARIDTSREKVLDLSVYTKDKIKLTQLIKSIENQINFKIVYDSPVSSEELDIIIDKDHYNEENILVTESIIGQINFITH